MIRGIPRVVPFVYPKLRDKLYRLENLYLISTSKNRPDVEVMTLKLNKTQRHFWQNRAKRNIVLKSRQHGFTTLGLIDMLDDILWAPNLEGLFVAQDLDTAKDIFD